MFWVYLILVFEWAVLLTAGVLSCRLIRRAGTWLLEHGLDFSVIGWFFYRVFMRKYAEVQQEATRSLPAAGVSLSGASRPRHQIGWGPTGHPYVLTTGRCRQADLEEIRAMLEYARRRYGSSQ